MKYLKKVVSTCTYNLFITNINFFSQDVGTYLLTYLYFKLVNFNNK